MAILAAPSSAERGLPEPGEYRIRLRVRTCEDAWEMRETACYYGGVELFGCCFAFRNDEQRMTALESLRFRFGPEYFESVDASALDSRTRLLFFAQDDERVRNHCRFFAEHGFLVSQATDWEAAMETICDWKPDVVIVKDDMLWSENEGANERNQGYADLATTAVVLIGKQKAGKGGMSCSALPTIASFHEPVPRDRLLETIRSIVSARHPGR